MSRVFSDQELSSDCISMRSISRDYKLCEFNKDNHGYGFKITGNCPVRVHGVRRDGNAWIAGLRENDEILEINGKAVKDKSHKDVVEIIRMSNRVVMKVNPGYSNQHSINEARSSKMSSSTSDIGQLTFNRTRIPTSHMSSTIKSPPTYKPNRSSISPKTTNSAHPSMNPTKRISQGPPPPSQSLVNSLMKQNSNNTEISKNDNDKFKKPLQMAPRPKSESNFKKQSQNNNNKSDNHNPVKKSISSASDSSTGSSSAASSKFSSTSTENTHPLNSDNVYELSPSNNSSSNKTTTEPAPTKLNHNNDLLPDKQHIKSHSYHVSSSIVSSKSYENIVPDSNRIKEKKKYLLDKMDSTNLDQVNLSNLDHNKVNNEHTISPILTRQNPTQNQGSPNMVKSATLQGNPTQNRESPTIAQSATLQGNTQRFYGRSFEDDNGEEDEISKAALAYDLLSDYKKALSHPGIVAVLVERAKDKNLDLNAIFFYFACISYEKQIERPEFKRNAKQMAYEIITTFLMDKSPIPVFINEEIIERIINNLQNGANMENIFLEARENSMPRITHYIEDFKNQCQTGILSINWEFLDDFEKEMSKLYRNFEPFNPKLSKENPLDDRQYAMQICYSTIYSVFLRDGSKFSESLRSRTKSTENLTQSIRFSSIQSTYKLPVLASFRDSKKISSIRKKTKNVSGHQMMMDCFEEPENCYVCSKLLWGPGPQGYRCNACEIKIHKDCRKKLKLNCSKKPKKFSSQVSLKEDKSIFGRLSRKSSTASVKSNVSINSEYQERPDSSNGNKHFDFIGHNTASIENGQEYCMDTTKRSASMHALNSPGITNIDYTPHTPVQRSSSSVVKKLVEEDHYDDPDMKVDESFDAGLDLTKYFPNLSENSDKKRLIILLEFFHKTRYILMNLKKLQYHLVKIWPENYEKEFKTLGLDTVDPFIKLLKSLVDLIKDCIEEQDFVNLGPKILDWISADEDKNLNYWITLGSHLVCSNSLNSTKQLKLQIRQNEDFIKVANSKFNKSFVLDELNQMRPILISIPLITKNITKFLGKSPELYADELEIWKNISMKFELICEFVDRCCIPLVELINSNCIKPRQNPMSKSNYELINSTEINGYNDYFYEFPKLLFQNRIYDHQYGKIFQCSSTIQRTNLQQSSNSSSSLSNTNIYASIKKSNNPSSNTSNNTTEGGGHSISMESSLTEYFKKGTEVLMILYEKFIIIIQKEQYGTDNYVLKLIKTRGSVDTFKIPILKIDVPGIIVNLGQCEDGYHPVNIILNVSESPLLMRIGFRSQEIAENWIHCIKNHKCNLERTISLMKSSNNLKTDLPRQQSMPIQATAPNTLNSLTSSASVADADELKSKSTSLPLPQTSKMNMEHNSGNNKELNSIPESTNDLQEENCQHIMANIVGDLIKCLPSNNPEEQENLLKDITNKSLNQKMSNILFDVQNNSLPIENPQNVLDLKMNLFDYCMKVLRLTDSVLKEDSLQNISKIMSTLTNTLPSVDKLPDNEHIIEINEVPKVRSELSIEDNEISNQDKESVKEIARDLVIEIIDDSVSRLSSTENNVNEDDLESKENIKTPPPTLPKPKTHHINNIVPYQCRPICSIEPTGSEINNGKHYSTTRDNVVTYSEPEPSRMCISSVTIQPTHPSPVTTPLSSTSANVPLSPMDETIPVRPRAQLLFKFNKPTHNNTANH